MRTTSWPACLEYLDGMAADPSRRARHRNLPALLHECLLSRSRSTRRRTAGARGDSPYAAVPPTAWIRPLRKRRSGSALGQLERALELCASLVEPAQAAQELGARRVEVPVAVEVEPVDEREPCRRARPPRRRRRRGSAPRPASRSAGELARRARRLRSSPVRIVAVQRRDRRLDRRRGRGRRARARGRAASRPRRSAPSFQRERSCSASSTSSPSAKRASRRASWISISASSPCTSGSSGMSAASALPSRSASAPRSTRPRVALVEDQVDDGRAPRPAVRAAGGRAARGTGCRPP